MQNINLKTKLEQLISEDAIKALNLCSEAAEICALKIFLIGGAVRDVILGKNSFDIDVTVEGNAVEFAKFLERNYPKICKVKEIHEKFTTAKAVFLFEKDEIIIDFASTRKESYPYPSSLPLVEEIGCSLLDDVKRRDFTINSMAMSLNKNSFGDLTDYLGGYQDLENKIIRILHDESFKDDPTRIIRALKFRVRFNCELDENTKFLQQKILQSGMFDNLCGERIKSETKQTFNLNKAECAEIFIRENIFTLVCKDISDQADFKICEKIIKEYRNFINPDFIWLIYLSLLLSGMEKQKISEVAENLYLSGDETEILMASKELINKVDDICNNIDKFGIYEFFEGLPNEALIILFIKNLHLKEKIDIYLKELKNIRIFTTGQTLIDLGLKPGVVFGKILKQLLKSRINGEFFTEAEEKIYLTNVILKNEV
jgi:tRNA nucleotidyltransferase/poly(A) polymerase